MKRGWDLTDAEFQILAFIGDRSPTALEINRGLKADLHTTNARLVHLTNTGMLSHREETGGEWRYVLTWRAWEELERKGGRSGGDQGERHTALRGIRLFFSGRWAGRGRSGGGSDHSAGKQG